ncbi:MAG: hypothetical protein WD825_14630 [Gemmatimonadaceae bacterium]
MPLLLAGCGAGDSAVDLQGASFRTAEAILSSARSIGAEHRVSVAQFRARNPKRDVGRFHNEMMRQFVLEIAKPRPHRRCASFRGAWTNTKKVFGRDTLKLIDARVESYFDSALATMCRGEKAGVRPASTSAPHVAPPATTALSGDPQPYLDAIQASVNSSSSGSEIVSTINAIVLDAESSLSGTELDAVYSATSIAVDSYDYWVTLANLEAAAMVVWREYDQMCVKISEPNSEECFEEFETSGPAGVGDARTPLRFASGETVPGCGDYISWRRVVGADIAGGIIGFFIGGVGAIPGAGLASAGALYSMALAMAICNTINRILYPY